MTASIFVISRQVLFCAFHALARRKTPGTSRLAIVPTPPNHILLPMSGEIQSLDFFLLCNSVADGHSDRSGNWRRAYDAQTDSTVQRRLHGNRNYLS